MYTDSHAHYDLKHFNNNRWSLLAECRRRGIGAILVPAIRPESNDTMMQTLDVETYPELLPQLDAEGVGPEELPEIYYAAGVHPTRVWNGTEEDDGWWEQKIRSAAGKKKVAAIGETGLDYHVELTPEMRERQMEWFHRQLRIGEELELPLVLHIRMADDDAISILKRYPLRQSGVVHCFNGGWETAREYLNLGLYLGVGGSITLEPYRASVGEALKKAPLDRLLMETDAPYVRPSWCTDPVNTSLVIPALARELAEIRGIQPEEVEQATTENFWAVYRIRGRHSSMENRLDG